MDIESKDMFEIVWELREEVIYPSLFGEKRNGIFVLSGELFTEVFQQNTYDPRWLTYGVLEFEPTLDRPSWLYVTSGASNPWEVEPSEYDKQEYSGFGTELVLEAPRQARWPILILQRLLAFNILLVHRRYGDAEPLDYGHRIPIRGPITLEGGSALTHIVLGEPDHYQRSFQLASGQVDFLHAAGISESERDYAKEHGSAELIALLKQHGAFPVTNPDRAAVVT